MDLTVPYRSYLSSVEEIIEEARNGRMFILVDDEDRENEGDLVIPAQMATPDAINFMAKHGRGLICLALSRERVDQLGLQPMSRTNGTRLSACMRTRVGRSGSTWPLTKAICSTPEALLRKVLAVQLPPQRLSNCASAVCSTIRSLRSR